MNHGDMLDSLVRPVIDELTAGSTGANQAGGYFISSSSSTGGNQSFSFINTSFC